jgi:poly(hydroxyalkanoate) depolymerase family esterase
METEMAEATRLTRMGQLLEATALIQRTLGGAPKASSSFTASTADEPIDVSFRVLEPAPETQPATTTMMTLPRRAAFPYEEQRTSAKVIDTAMTSRRTDEPPDSTSRATSEPAGWQARLCTSVQAHRDIWAGGQFIEGSFTNKAGTRAYKLYVPKGYRGQALPLVVMLHGCTQNPDDFAAGTRMNLLAEREQFLVVYPAQTVSSNQSKCWKWFNKTDQQRERGEPSIIAGITRKILGTYHCNPGQVYVAGMSAGGAMAVIMGVSYPDLYSAIGVHSGLPYAVAHDLPSALAAMKRGAGTPAGTQISRSSTDRVHARSVPTIVFHGDRDTTVHPRNGDQVLAQMEAFAPGSKTTNLHKTVKRIQVANRREYTHTLYHNAAGDILMERWLVHGAGHAWSGGSPHGSFTDPQGPDASQEMMRFFLRTSAPR